MKFTKVPDRDGLYRVRYPGNTCDYIEVSEGEGYFLNRKTLTRQSTVSASSDELASATIAFVASNKDRPKLFKNALALDLLLNRRNVEWVGIDFDGTIAEHEPASDLRIPGAPVPAIVDLALNLLENLVQVKIFTARVYPLNICVWPDTELKFLPFQHRNVEDSVAHVRAVQQFCLDNLGFVLPVTNIKDYAMSQLYDDRAIQVIRNKGTLVG
jgi:hypothetical protein